MHPGFRQKGRAEVIAHSNLGNLPLLHKPPLKVCPLRTNPSIRPTIFSGVLAATPCQARSQAAAAFRCILSIWVVAAAPPPTRCARSAQSALRCGCLIPKGTATAPAPRPPAGGRVGGKGVWRGVTRRWRWDDVIGDGMEVFALVLASCREYLVPVRLNRFARSWS